MMNILYPSILAVTLVTLTSLALLLASDWRSSIAALAAQYLGVAALVAIQSPAAAWPEMAITKLVAGWMAGAILGIAIVGIPGFVSRADIPPRHPERYRYSDRLFALLAAILVFLVLLSQIQKAENWIPGIRLEVAWGGMVLIALGMLKLGFSTEILPTILGILTAFAGFEVIYNALETSALVAGLLSLVTLGIALAGAYLLVAPLIEENE